MTFADILSPVVSAIALAISIYTLWFTILHRGTVRSTHPSFIAFRYDFVGTKVPLAKIFLRTLLVSTAKRGQVIESLYLRVREGSRSAEFSFWGHGDKELVRGSGLFIPETGVATNHHFNPLDTETVFLFSGGTYTLELVAKLIGCERPQSLWCIDLEVPAGVFGTTIAHDKAIYFSYSPGKKCFLATVESRFGPTQALLDSQG
jgi:hypothetical protein